MHILQAVKEAAQNGGVSRSSQMFDNDFGLKHSRIVAPCI